MPVLMPTSSPRRVDQRAAGIARIDRGVGLDEVFVVGEADVGAARRADDAGGDRLAELERAADGQHPLADLQLGRVAPRHRDEARDVNLQQRNVGGGIGADDRCRASRACRPAPP